MKSLFSKTGVLSYYPYNSTSDTYSFCGSSTNSTVTYVLCKSDGVYNLFITCSLQNEISVSDFLGKFRMLYYSTEFYMFLTTCTVERGFLGNFPQTGKERIYSITLNRCENSLPILGVTPFWNIYIVLDKATSTTIDLGLLRGSFSLTNFDKLKLPHTIYYNNTGTIYTNQIGTLTTFASHYPPLGPYLNIGILNLNLLDNYDRSTVSNVLDYGSIQTVNIHEYFTSEIPTIIPPIDKMPNKTITQSFSLYGYFYTDRLLDYSPFTALYGIEITRSNNLRDFKAPGNKFALSGLPKNLVTSPPAYFKLIGFGGVFSTTSDYAVFKNTAPDIFIKDSNGIEGPLPSWDTTIKSIKTLDFSYNRLNGTLDDSFCSIQKFVVDYNSLTGEIPSCMKCYMQKTPGSITIKGNRFTNNNNNQTCTSIIPSYLVVNGSGSYLFGKDLGFNGSYVTSTPTAKWVVNTPSSVLYTSTKFQANTKVSLTFSIIDKVLTVPVNISAPVFDSIEAKTNEKISFSGSYFTYNASDIQITLYDKKGQSYSCPVIQGDSTFSSISCNITNFSQLKDESNVKAIIRIGIYTNQLSINFGIINSPISMCSDNQCNERSYCLTNNATCTCNYGYTGLPDCTTPHYDCLNDCSSSSGGGTCNYSTGVCNCNQYRDGTDCSSILCKNSCFNGGTCDKTIGECKCSSNYQGKDCSIPFIKCSSNCLNGGSCNNVTGECVCLSGYEGPACSLKKCSNDCLNGGTCDSTIGQCKCTQGYQGNDCSIPFIKCLSDCLNGGTCNNVTGQCKCGEDYQGSDCSKPFIECSNNCLNGGTCDSTIGRCKCTQDYQGDDCSTTFIKCLSDCLNGGTCNNVTGQCKCNEGYQDSDCSKPFIECSNKCLNGGTCDNAIGKCICSNEYQGDDCSSKKCTSNSCLNGGTCNLSTYNCQCINGYQGDDCSILHCSNNCLNGGSCDLSIGECKCNEDYQGPDCSIPFIECKNVCGRNGDCNNQTGHCIYECPTQCYNQGKCDQETGICKCPTIEFIGIDCSIPNHWVSSINETSNTGGEVTLYGWFGDLHNNLSVLIGQLNCDNPVAIDSKTIKCQLPSGQSGIKNVNVTQNEIIWIGKDLYHYIDNDSNIKENNCLNNCNNRGICLSSGECRCNDGWKGLDCNSLGSSDSTNTDVDNNGKTTINDNYNNYEIFIDKLIELDFNGQQVKVYDLNKKWEKVINDTNNNSIQSFNQKLDNNQGELIYKVEIIDQTKDYSFSDLTYRLEKGSIKISMFINNYTYSNTLNTLQLQMISTTENIEDKGNECNQKDTEIESNSNQLLNFVTIKKDNKVLYGRFINKVISDGRSTHLKTSVISSDQIKSTVTMGMDLPHCRNCIIDPDFSLLLTSNFKDSCGDDDNRKSYVIPVAVVASVAGVAAIGASGFLIYRKKKVELSQAKLRKITKK
ncbi:hypothetical protein ACTA71_003767 [Dictyostelium dimigraforme]